MTEPQSNKPITAAEAFEAAGENLRQAEKAWSDTRVPDALLGRAIEIANAWTALGVGLSGVLQEWTVVKDEPNRHLWSSTAPMLCVRCGTSEIGTFCVVPPGIHMHDWDEDSGLCKAPQCVAFQGSINALSDCPVLPAPSSPHEHTAACRHQWVRPLEPCANRCGTRPEDTRTDLPYCSATCPDVTA